MKLLFLGIGSIIASIIIGNVLQIGVFLVTAVSVFAASVIAGKYRKVFNKMEEGNKV